MITRWLGRLALVLLVAGIAAVAIGAWRIARYEQREEEGALDRKAAELARMAAGAHAHAQRPNVVLILFDDLGLGDLGAYGSRALRTPRLDQLAEEGTAFDQYYAPATESPGSHAWRSPTSRSSPRTLAAGSSLEPYSSIRPGQFASALAM